MSRWSKPRFADSRFETAQAALGGGGGPPGPPGYDVILLAGQSNEVGYGGPATGADVGGASVLQYACAGPSIDTVIASTEPLWHPDTQNQAGSGLTNPINVPCIGHGTAFARAYVSGGRLASNRKLLLVPVAFGSTGLVFSGYWAVGGTGFAFAVTQANKAMAVDYGLPGSVNRFLGAIWLQGETDAAAGIAADVYAYEIDRTIAGFRAQITGASASWFLPGQFVPETIPSRPTWQVIDAALQDVTNRVPNSKFWFGATGSGENIHYSAATQRTNGAIAYAAMLTLPNTTVVPGTPTSLSASNPTAGTVDLSWTAPAATGSIITDYKVQFSLAGAGSWSTFAHARQITTTITVTGLVESTAYDFRVMANNTAGDSTPSNTASATTAAAVAIIWDSAKTTAGIVLSESDTRATPDGSPTAWNAVLSNIGRSSGKYYFELKAASFGASNNQIVGLATTNADYNQYIGQWASSMGFQGNGGRFRNGFTVGVGQTVTITALNQIVRFAVDFTAGKLWVSCTNASNAFQNGGDPATGANPCETFTPGATFYIATALEASVLTNSIKLLVGADLTLSPPSGFVTW